MKINRRLAAAAALTLGAGGLAAVLFAPADATGVPNATGTWTCSAADGSTLVGQLLQGTSIQLSMGFDTQALDAEVAPGSTLSSFAFPATLPLGGYVDRLAGAGVQSMAVSISSFPLAIGTPTPQTVSTSLISPQTALPQVADPGIKLANTVTSPVTAPTTPGSYAVTAPAAFQADIVLVDPAVAGGSTAPFNAGALSCSGSPVSLGTLDDGVAPSPTPTPTPTPSPSPTPTGPALPSTTVSASLAKATITEGQVARVSATVTGGDEPVSGQVVARIGRSTWSGPVDLRKDAATLDLRGLSAGDYTVTIAYLGDAEHAPSSADVALTVAPARSAKG